jgi:hypothetical protein
MHWSRLLFVAALVAACDRQATPEEAKVAHKPARDSMHVLYPFATVDSTAAAAIAAATADDRGVVIPIITAAPIGLPRNLEVSSDPDSTANVIAYVDFYARPDGGWSDSLRSVTPNLFGQLTRAGHEDYGLPFDSLFGAWARVTYGYTADGREHKGWVHLKKDSVGVVTYDQIMMQYQSWFADPASVVLYDQPNGRVVPPFPFELGYSMRVVSVTPEWIGVHLVVPDTTECSGNPSAPVRGRALLYLRRESSNPQKQIWSAVAGC